MKHRLYVGHINTVLGKKIVINIHHLEEGIYELKIINDNKILRSIEFYKD